MSEWGLSKAEKADLDRRRQEAKNANKPKKGKRRFGRESKKDGEK